MQNSKRVAAGLIVAGAGMAIAVGTAGQSSAAPNVCGALPGQAAATGDCWAKAGPTGLSLSIAADSGAAWSSADGYSGPAAIAIGDGASVKATGIKPGLAIGIAGPGAQVVIDGKNGPVCTGGPSFAGDFQTLKGCWK